MLKLIGKTPMIRLTKIEKLFGLKGRIFAKAEYLNPGGSIKDRAALAMLEDAERRGLIKKGSLICEPTSGNTGIALAMIGALKGYRVKIVMPESASSERERLMSAYGAEVVRVTGGMSEAIKISEDIRKCDGALILDQFHNNACVECHYSGTGAEIWHDMGGDISLFAAGVGTGATLSGVGRYLKKRGRVHITAIEPSESAVLSGGKNASHGIDGIGAGFIPPLYDSRCVDEVVRVSSSEAIEMAGILARNEGILAGISTGANLCAAVRLGKQTCGNIVVPICDRGERYFSKNIF